MIKVETLRSWRRVVNKMDHHPSTERERQLIDSNLEAHLIIDRVELLADRFERDAASGSGAAIVAGAIAQEIRKALENP